MSAQIPEAPPSRAVSNYTQALRNLTDEIARGMRAIAENRIAELRDSLVRQQSHCALVQAAAEVVESLQDRGSRPMPELTGAMAAARKELLHMTRAYEGLVERGRRTTSLLESLCGSYAGQYSTGLQPLRGRLHLSCEA